jgi:hypothetical protein
MPLVYSNGSKSDVSSFPGWPAKSENRLLKELPLTEREKKFDDGFPGRTGRFSDGSREIVIRWVMEETRKLHPAADCFKGIGYKVRPMPVRVDNDGNHWGSFEAERDNERILVRERIYDGAGNSWADVSAWYWAAFTGKTSGPWWAVTVAEKN